MADNYSPSHGPNSLSQIRSLALRHRRAKQIKRALELLGGALDYINEPDQFDESEKFCLANEIEDFLNEFK